MAFRYLAKVYVDNEEVAHESGNDVDELYNWMLTKAQGKFENFSGEIIDQKTHQIVKSFRKAPLD
ncbi:MAG: hypothetical protein EPO11_08060 [Gammaproteobacteria bacterium]|nr:MAG: hypothetical protein EPO11_08060 [Gammaproteobacteria bacterium]